MANRLYFASIYDGDIGVVNPDTNESNIIYQSSLPRAVAADPDTNEIYVGDENSDDIKVVDGATDSIVASIPVGPNMRDVAVNPGIDRVYVAYCNTYCNSGSVSVIDQVTRSVVATVPANGTLVAANPADNHVYVVKDDNVKVIDGMTNNIAGTIDLEGPGTSAYVSDVVADPETNRIYVAGDILNEGHIWVIDSATGAVENTIHTGGPPTPRRLAVDSALGRIYLYSSNGGGDDTLSTIDVSTGNLLNRIDIPSTAFALTLNSATGRIYLAMTETNRVSVRDSATLRELATVEVAAEPRDIAVPDHQSSLHC